MRVFEIGIGNYRGSLQIAADINNKYYWRVYCDLDEHEDVYEWREISESLYNKLMSEMTDELLSVESLHHGG